MRTDNYIGKVLNHPQLGKVTVDSKVANSRTMVEVTVIDRGEGWNELKQRYTGVTKHGVDFKGRKTTSWQRGENKQFGHKDIVHINTLN